MLELRDAGAGRARRRLAVVGQTLTYYDGAAFVGLPLGQLGDFGAPVRTESLVLTDEVAARGAYRRRRPIPPYLVPGGAPAWTAEYPPEFRERLPALAGYISRPATATG